MRMKQMETAIDGFHIYRDGVGAVSVAIGHDRPQLRLTLSRDAVRLIATVLNQITEPDE